MRYRYQCELSVRFNLILLKAGTLLSSKYTNVTHTGAKAMQSEKITSLPQCDDKNLMCPDFGALAVSVKQCQRAAHAV